MLPPRQHGIIFLLAEADSVLVLLSMQVSGLGCRTKTLSHSAWYANSCTTLRSYRTICSTMNRYDAVSQAFG